MRDLQDQEANYKIHKKWRNGTLKQREDKRTKDALYRAVTERKH